MTYDVPGGPADLALLARRLWYWPATRGVMAVLFGLLAMLLPLGTASALVRLFGAFVVVGGLVSLVDGVRRRGSRARSANVGVGVAEVLFGLVLLLLPGVVLGVALVLVAVWAAFFGVVQLLVAFAMRSRGGTSWLWSLLSAVLLLALAVVCLAQPRATVAVMAVVVGAFAVAIGVALVALGLRLRSWGSAAGPAGSPGRRVIEGEIVDE